MQLISNQFRGWDNVGGCSSPVSLRSPRFFLYLISCRPLFRLKILQEIVTSRFSHSRCFITSSTDADSKYWSTCQTAFSCQACLVMSGCSEYPSNLSICPKSQLDSGSAQSKTRSPTWRPVAAWDSLDEAC